MHQISGINPSKFLAELSEYVAAKFGESYGDMALLQNTPNLDLGTVATIRKATVQNLEMCYSYQTQFFSWKTNVILSSYGIPANSVQQIQNDLAKLRKLCQEILQSSSSVLYELHSF